MVEPILETVKKYHHGALRDTLLRVARQLLEESDVESVGLREVARISGVSANAPYRHFADKEALLAAVAAQGFQELLEGLRASDEANPESESYIKGCRSYIAFATEHAAITRLMFERFSGKYSTYPELKAAASDCLDQFITMVARHYRLSPRSDKAFTCAISVWSLLHGYAMLKSAGALGFPRQDLLPTPEQLSAMITPLLLADTEPVLNENSP